jgi:hypothetical protein
MASLAAIQLRRLAPGSLSAHLYRECSDVVRRRVFSQKRSSTAPKFCQPIALRNPLSQTLFQMGNYLGIALTVAAKRRRWLGEKEILSHGHCGVVSKISRVDVFANDVPSGNLGRHARLEATLMPLRETV